VYVYPPTLGEAIVEECARAGRIGFYTDTGDGDRRCPAWEKLTEGSREEWRAHARAALTHYRERVERPLREELHRWQHGQQIESDYLCQPSLDLLEKSETIAKLRAELAALKAREADRCEKISALLEVPARPAPEVDGERHKAAHYVRDCAARGNAMAVDAAERIATLLESPAPRKSLGRRWVVQKPNGEVLTFTFDDVARRNAEHYGGTVTECDLVPVEEGE
jgi:hypothetical protein